MSTLTGAGGQVVSLTPPDNGPIYCESCGTRRPRTLSVVEAPASPTSTIHLGPVKRASPPPDLMRVASSFALLGALMLALILSWALGG